jgi:hypothetical protein
MAAITSATSTPMGRPQGWPQPGDIVLFAHAKGLNRIITFLTRSRFYHVAIYAGGSHVVEARPRGVIERDLNGPEGTQIDAFIPMAPDIGQKALAWARRQIGAKYDRFDILVMIFERLFRHLHVNYAPPGKYSCGQFVARAFLEAGAELLPDLRPEEVVPGDFEKLGPQPIDRAKERAVPEER